MAQAQSRARCPWSGASSAPPSTCSPPPSDVVPTQTMYESTKQIICIASGGKLESDPVSCFETILIASSLIPIVSGPMSVCGDIGNDRDRPPCTYDGQDRSKGGLTRGLHKNCNRTAAAEKEQEKGYQTRQVTTVRSSTVCTCSICSCEYVTFTAGDLWGKNMVGGGRGGEGDIDGRRRD